MTTWRQGWLVARREMRERSRTRAFRISLVLMVVVVVALVAVPGLLAGRDDRKVVGVIGSVPPAFPIVLEEQGSATDTLVELRRFESLPAGEEQLRDDEIDVLVVDARRLEWRDPPEPALQSIVTTAVQVSVVHERAASAGIDQETAATVLAPIPLTNTVIGIVAGRDADDETAAALVTVVLLAAILVYGNLVLSGVAEEKSSRVVEVLLARLPAKALLGGKVVGIGLLGLAQLTLTAVAALVAALAVDSVEPPTVTDGVLAWVIVWFALGYALYAMVYGALGSLASRTEDAQSVAGPVGYLMVAGYWASFVAIGQDPDGPWSRLLSLLPVTAPLAMPGRIALGVTSWWEPLLAAVLTLVAIAALVAVAGRVYENAILHTGARLRLRDTWHGAHDAEPRTDPAERHRASATVWAVVIGAAGLGTSAAVFVLTHDVVWSLVPLLLAIAALRATLHRGDDKPV